MNDDEKVAFWSIGKEWEDVCEERLEAQARRAPRERPILFSAPMVLALLAGRKTQTRRIIQPAGVVKVDGGGQPFTDRWDKEEDHAWRRDVRCPYGVPGDRLWVKESFRLRADQDHIPPSKDPWKSRPWYEATGNGETPSGCGGGIGRLRSSIHMPRWASRIDLEITEVRVQRLHDISEDDAAAEGVERDTSPCDHTRASCADVGCLGPTHRATYAELWQAINGAGSWAANPWVWALSFRRVRP